MKNINNVTSKNIKDLNYKLRLSYDEARHDSVTKDLMDSINLSDDELMKNTTAFIDATEEFKHCKNCKGLAGCKNKMIGYCYLPILNEEGLIFSYVACKYKNRYLKDTNYLKNITDFDVPREIKEAKMKDIYTDDLNRIEVIKWLTKYIKDYKSGVVNKGLFLHGNFGCGKTYLIAAMFNELAKNNVKSAIVYWPEYLRSLKTSYSSTSRDEFKNRFDSVKYAKLLLIDDLGAETVTSWSRDEILGTILQYRMQEKLPTFITSNLNIKELGEHLSVTSNKSEKVKSLRIIERVKQLTTDIEMISKNNRE